MTTTAVPRITDEQRRQYREEGYFVLERALPDDALELLRGACEQFVREADAQMDAAGTDSLGLNHRNSRYFVPHPSLRDERLKAVYFSDLFAEICRATIGDEAYAFWEQYVVKAAEQGMKFGWHQDSGFEEGIKHQPYVTCWCALDDMTEANGTIYVLPFSRAGGSQLVPHTLEAGTNDRIGYHGDDPGDIVEVPAGSIAVFSSVTFHRSGTNTTDRMRRVYLAQYAPEIIPNRDGTAPFGRDEHFLSDGRRLI
jgi:ectoine hydroxylase-related dioxygenase (phytanoyl-CoA dioxygenase family)